MTDFFDGQCHWTDGYCCDMQHITTDYHVPPRQFLLWDLVIAHWLYAWRTMMMGAT